MTQAGYLKDVVDETAQEMAINAAWHGANETGAYVAAQRYRYSDDPNVCVLAIGDLGVGMAAHLQRSGLGQEDDSATIAHGMSDMVSGTLHPHRGRGYSVPFELARQKEAARIDLRVRANDGWVHKHNDNPPAGIDHSWPTCQGTWVEFTFSHKNPAG